MTRPVNQVGIPRVPKQSGNKSGRQRLKSVSTPCIKRQERRTESVGQPHFACARTHQTYIHVPANNRSFRRSQHRLSHKENEPHLLLLPTKNLAIALLFILPIPGSNLIPICTFRHSIVLNGPERAWKLTRNGPSCTHDSRNVSNGPKAEARTHTPNSQPCRRAHKRAIQCDNLRIRRPRSSCNESSRPVANKKRAVTQARGPSRASSSYN